ncbi:MAG: hypothetical protein WBB19_04475 [Desulforhopalus sp.]
MKITTFIASTTIIIVAFSAAAQDPQKLENNSWISLSGTVVEAGPDSFELDYGKGVLTVEMDGWGWYNRASTILEDDKVTVNGRIDDDFYELTSIEASSVYVEGMNTFFYANDLDEEDMFWDVVTSDDVYGGVQLRGVVTEINGREFVVDSGLRKIKVDTGEMTYNPLDDKGYQKIDKGDFVLVTGGFDVDVYEPAEIMANSVVSLEKDKTKKANNH